MSDNKFLYNLISLFFDISFEFIKKNKIFQAYEQQAPVSSHLYAVVVEFNGERKC